MIRVGLALSALLIAGGVTAEAAPRTFVMPPKARPIAGVIHEARLAPIYRQDFVCEEHFSGQLAYAGDALGTDCMVVAGVDGDSGYNRLFRTNGAANVDWYGWGADVLAPVSGTVIGTIEKPEINTPGTLGKPPAAMVQIRTPAGVIIFLAHVRNIRVALGQRVKAGDVVGQVGNNGFARNPHIHVGAFVEATAEPLQIRWDLEAMAKLRS